MSESDERAEEGACRQSPFERQFRWRQKHARSQKGGAFVDGFILLTIAIEIIFIAVFDYDLSSDCGRIAGRQVGYSHEQDGDAGQFWDDDADVGGHEDSQGAFGLWRACTDASEQFGGNGGRRRRPEPCTQQQSFPRKHQSGQSGCLPQSGHHGSCCNSVAAPSDS